MADFQIRVLFRGGKEFIFNAKKINPYSDVHTVGMRLQVDGIDVASVGRQTGYMVNKTIKFYNVTPRSTIKHFIPEFNEEDNDFRLIDILEIRPIGNYNLP